MNHFPLSKILLPISFLFHRKADAPLNIMTDAYDIVVGAVFQQFVDYTWQHFAISHVNSNQLKLVTAPTIENSLLFICPSNIFNILLKDAKFMSLLTINHLLILFSQIPTGTPPVKSDTSTSFHSSPQISDMSMALTTQ